MDVSYPNSRHFLEFSRAQPLARSNSGANFDPKDRNKTFVMVFIDILFSEHYYLMFKGSIA